MRGYSLSLAAFALLISVVSATLLSKAQAEARPVTKTGSSWYSSMGSSSQELRDLQTARKNPFKKVDTNFGRIPPSGSNPIQNKYNPPLAGERNRKQRIPRSQQH